MSAPVRIQLHRTKGWRMPPNTVKVDRTTRWGNPFHHHGDGYPMEPRIAVECFRNLLASARPATVEEVREHLRGKNLACWCPIGSPCHADVLLEIANADVG